MSAEEQSNDVKPLGWWTISGEDILDALRRCAAGEQPDAVYAEMYANSDHEHFGAGGAS